jgi:phosphatidylglycerol lysyltransferase
MSDDIQPTVPPADTPAAPTAAPAQRSQSGQRAQTGQRAQPSEPTPPSRATRALAGIGRWARRRPATIALTIVIAALSVWGFASSTYGWGWDILNTGQDDVFVEHHWWGIFTAFLAADGWPSLIAVVPLLLVVVGESERLMGTWRVLVAYLGGSATAALLGFAISYGERTVLEYVPLSAASVDTLSPATGVVCAAMAASAFTGALWRRRIRLFATLFAVTLFLYAGGAGDLFALLAVPIGLGIGFLLGGSRSRLRLVRSSHHETRVLLASIVALGGVGPILAGQIGTGDGLLSLYGALSFDPVSSADGVLCALGSASAPCSSTADSLLDAHSAVALISVFPMLAMLFIAWGVFLGRRVALWLAVVANVLLSGAISIYFGLTPATLPQLFPTINELDTAIDRRALVSFIVCALLPLAVALLLILMRRHVAVRSTGTALRRFVVTLLAGAFGAAALSFVGTWMLRDQFRPAISAVDILKELPLRLAPPSFVVSDGLGFIPVTPWADLFWYGPSILFGLVLVAAVARLVLSPSAVPGTDDRLRARALLEQGGGDTLAFMSTWPGNSFWFDGETRAAVAYRVRGAVAVTTGGPFGPDHDDPAVIRRFIRFCGDNGWTPAFYGIDDRSVSAFDDLGWHRLEIAEEAIVLPQQWSTTGKKWQDIRTSINRAERAGIVAEWTSWPEMSLSKRSQVQAMSEAWVADKELPEMEFTLGGFDELADPAVRIMLAVDGEGQIEAATSWLPSYGPDGVIGYTLDFMRRRADGMNGTMEFLIAKSATTMQAEGIQFMSLSGAPLAKSGGGGQADGEASTIARLLDYIGTSLEPVYGFRSLLNFKRKFQPTFVPLWLVYPDAVHLPAIGVALVRSYIPELSVADAARFVRDMREPRAVV